MLIEFSIKNHLSFKEKVTLSMVASKDDSLPGNVIKNAQGSGIDLLKSAIIYGANASGKSNLIKAILFMGDFVASSTFRQDSVINVIPFQLDPDCLKQPSEFDARFLIDGTIYNYGFSADRERIHQEWLYSFPKEQKRVLFERDKKGSGSEFYFGPHFKGEKKSLIKLTRPDSLFLTVASNHNHDDAVKITDYFRLWNLCASYQPSLLHRESYYPLFQAPSVFFDNRSEIRNEFKKIIKNADTGISDFYIDDSLNTSTTSNSYKINIIHRIIGKNGNPVEATFKFWEESEGTQQWLGLAILIPRILRHGAVLPLDELDLKLHPLLSREIVSSFHREDTNSKNAQLIGTTHNTDLLDRLIFRRDQIWLTEKKHGTGATDLYSLWDFKSKKPRKEEDFRKNYLAGRYGAVPILEKFEL